jgi:hypothetical protein
MATFRFLVLKSLTEANTEPQTQTQSRKDPTMFSQTQAQSVIDRALEPLKKAIKQAHKDKDHPGELDARRNLAAAKMILSENARRTTPGGSYDHHMGPGYTRLFSRTGTLGEDSAVRGI